MINGFIAVGVSYNDITYISNTNPILWDSNKENAKVYDNYQTIRNELEDDFASLSATITYTNINTIMICEYVNGIEVGRENFI